MALTNVYGTLAQLRTAAGLQATDQSKDAALEIAGNSGARSIDSHCDRRFWQDSVVQTVEFDVEEDPRRFELPGVFDISTTTGLIVKVDTSVDGTYATTLTLNTDFVVRRPQGKPTSWPYTEIRLTPSSQAVFPLCTAYPSLQITAKYGWPTTYPDDVTEAWLVQSVQLFKSDAAPFGGVSLGLDGGVLRLGARLHPVAAGLLEPYVRTSV